MPAASSKKLEDDERKKKQPGPLASLQAAMEEEVGASRIEADRTESPDMFDSEEENSDKAGKEKAAGGKEKAKQSKRLKKNEVSESCKAGSEEIEESESECMNLNIGNCGRWIRRAKARRARTKEAYRKEQLLDIRSSPQDSRVGGGKSGRKPILGRFPFPCQKE